MTNNYREEMEQDDPELIDEIHACYSHISDLENRIRKLNDIITDLENRVRLQEEIIKDSQEKDYYGRLYKSAMDDNEKLNDMISKYLNELREAELNLQVFEKQWLLYKQKSDLAVEEILKLRGEVNDNNIEINNKTIKLHHQTEKIAKLEEDVTHWFNEFQAEKTAAHKKVGELQDALQWYTEKANIERYIGTSEHHSNGEHWFNCWMMSPVTNIARKALGMKTETEELLNGRSNNSR